MKRLIENKRVLRHSLLAATALFTCVAIQADHEKTAGDQAHGDKAAKFIQEAAAGGQMEVKLGQLAQQNGQTQEVKNLGQTLAQDHQKANQELMALAQQKNIQVSQDLGKHQRMVDRLQSKSGADFDKAFVTMAVKDHKKDIAKFEKCSKDVGDADLKAFIDKTLPTLRNHLQMAQTAAHNLGISEATLSAVDREDNEAAGAPGEAERGGSLNKEKRDNLNQNRDLNKNSSDKRFQGSLDQAPGTIPDGAVQTDSSLTINKNTPAASSSADVTVDTSKGDHKVLGVTTEKNDGKVLGVQTQKGDHKILGLNTSKDDGKLLGIIPWRRHHKAEMNMDVNQSSSVGAPASSSSDQGSSSSSDKRY